MTTKLLPRLIATAAAAAALTGAGAVTGLVSSAHATTPVVTRASNGGIDVNLTAAQAEEAAVSQAAARPLCEATIVPEATALSSSLSLLSCMYYDHTYSLIMKNKGAIANGIIINYPTNTSVPSVRAR